MSALESSDAAEALSPLESHIETLTQRQLRNESGRVMRAVKAGQEFIITSSGEPIAKLIPIERKLPPPPISRPRKRVGGWSELGFERKPARVPLAEMIDELREERV